MHGQVQQVKVEDDSKEHEDGQSSPSTHENGRPDSGTTGAQVEPIESGPAQGSGDLDIEAITANFFEEVDTQHPAVQLGPGDIVDEVHFSWVAENAENDRNGVQVRTNFSSKQVFQLFTLTLLINRTQVQAGIPEQATKTMRLTIASHFNHLLAPHRSPKKSASDSSLLLVHSQPSLTKPRKPNFYYYGARHQTAETDNEMQRFWAGLWRETIIVITSSFKKQGQKESTMILQWWN